MRYTCVRDRTLYGKFRVMCRVILIFKREMTDMLLHQVKKCINIAQKSFAAKFCYCYGNKELK